LGTVALTAEPPEIEEGPSPIELNAVTLIVTEFPKTRLNGDVYSAP